MMKLRILVVFFLLSQLAISQENRSIDGFGNNKQNPEWGSAGSIMPSDASNGFNDGFSSPAGATRPNARVVSNELFDQQSDLPDERNLSEFVWVFGQFIDHDLSHVKSNFQEIIGVKVPQNDQYFQAGFQIPFARSDFAPGTGNSMDNPRKYINQISSFIDASHIYGSYENRANWMRTFEKGKLKTSSDNFLPWNTQNGEFNSPLNPLAPFMDNDIGTGGKLYVSGDQRSNENPLLLCLHTIFLREHNRICEDIATVYPHLDDEIIYQRARKFVGAYIQSVVYNEWLPAMGVDLPIYIGYNQNMDPGIRNEFSAAAFRLGHTLINDDLIRLTIDGDTLIQGNVDLKHSFFNPSIIAVTGGIEPFLAGIAQRKQQLSDTKIVDGLRNFLFGVPGSGGLDLATLNIMRGRDRGLVDYNAIRTHYGLNRVNKLSEITQDINLQNSLNFLYGNVDNIDPWVGMLAEDRLEDKMFGELLYQILKTQFGALRDGDRYYFENDPAFSQQEIEAIRHTRFSDIIKRNTLLTNIQDYVFFVEKDNENDKGPELLMVQLDAVLFPNPASDYIQVKYYLTEAASVRLSCLNLMGQRIFIENQKGLNGNNLMEINFDLPVGVYHFMLEANNHFKIFKVLVEDK